MDRLISKMIEWLVVAEPGTIVTLEFMFAVFAASPLEEGILLVDEHTWSHVVDAMKQPDSGLLIDEVSGRVCLSQVALSRVLGVPAGVILDHVDKHNLLQRVYAAGPNGISFGDLSQASEQTSANIISYVMSTWDQMGCVRVWGSATARCVTHQVFAVHEKELRTSKGAYEDFIALLGNAPNRRMLQCEGFEFYTRHCKDRNALVTSKKTFFRLLDDDSRIRKVMTKQGCVVEMIVPPPSSSSDTTLLPQPITPLLPDSGPEEGDTGLPFRAIVLACLRAAEGRAVTVQSMAAFAGMDTDVAMAEVRSMQRTSRLETAKYVAGKTVFIAAFEHGMELDDDHDSQSTSFTIPPVAVSVLVGYPRWEFVEVSRVAYGGAGVVVPSDRAKDSQRTTLFLTRSRLLVELVLSSPHKALFLSEAIRELKVTHRIMYKIVDYVVGKGDLVQCTLPSGISYLKDSALKEDVSANLSTKERHTTQRPKVQLEVHKYFTSMPPRVKTIANDDTMATKRLFMIANGWMKEISKRVRLLHAYLFHLTQQTQTLQHNYSEVLDQMPMLLFCQVIGYHSGFFPKEHALVPLATFTACPEQQRDLRAQALIRLHSLWLFMENAGVLEGRYWSGRLVTLQLKSQAGADHTFDIHGPPQELRESITKFWNQFSKSDLTKGKVIHLSKLQCDAIKAFYVETPHPTLEQFRELAERVKIQFQVLLRYWFHGGLQRDHIGSANDVPASSRVYDKRRGNRHPSTKEYRKKRHRETPTDREEEAKRGEFFLGVNISDRDFCKAFALTSNLNIKDCNYAAMAMQLAISDPNDQFIKACKVKRQEYSDIIDHLLSVRVLSKAKGLSEEDSEGQLEYALNTYFSPHRELVMSSPQSLPLVCLPGTFADVAKNFEKFEIRGGRIYEWRENTDATLQALHKILRSILLTPREQYSSDFAVDLLEGFTNDSYEAACQYLRAAGVVTAKPMRKEARLTRLSLNPKLRFPRRIFPFCAQEDRDVARLTHLYVTGRVRLERVEGGGGISMQTEDQTWERPLQDAVLASWGTTTKPLQAIPEFCPTGTEEAACRLLEVLKGSVEGHVASQLPHADLLPYFVATGMVRFDAGSGRYVHPQRWNVRAGHGVSVFRSVTREPCPPGSGRWIQTELERIKLVVMDYVMGNPGVLESAIVNQLRIYAPDEVRSVLRMMVDEAQLEMEFVLHRRSVGWGGRGMEVETAQTEAFYTVNFEGLVLRDDSRHLIGS